MEFACSSCVSEGALRLLRLSSKKVQKHACMNTEIVFVHTCGPAMDRRPGFRSMKAGINSSRPFIFTGA